MLIKVLRVTVFVILVAVAGGLAVVTVKDGRELEKYAQVIEEHKGEKKKIRGKRAERQTEIKGLREEMEALSDSLRSARMGRFMRSSQEIAKALSVLDDRTLRANNLIRNAKKHQAEIRSHRRRWVIGYGAALALLVGTLLIFWKTRPRPDH